MNRFYPWSEAEVCWGFEGQVVRHARPLRRVAGGAVEPEHLVQLLHGALELLVRRKPRRRLRVNEQLAAGCKSERPGRFKPYTAVSGAAEAAERDQRLKPESARNKELADKVINAVKKMPEADIKERVRQARVDFEYIRLIPAP